MKKILCLTSHDLNAPDYGPVMRGRRIFQMLSEFGEVRLALGSRYEDVIKNAKSPQGGFELVETFLFPETCYSIASKMRNKLTPRFLDVEGHQVEARDRKKLESLIAEHDLIWVHGLELANNFGIWRWPKTVLDVDDIPSNVYRLRVSKAPSLSFKLWYCRKMFSWRRHEKQIMRRFDAICVCSEPDRKDLGGGDRIFVLPNAFETPKSAPVRHPASPPQIGFVGTFIYWANLEGVGWFVEKVWPLILEKFPQARLRLAGEGSQKAISGHNIDALGWVSNMEKEMANWSMAIVPILAGGGTRIKILEAFSRKCPVISTPVGAYGHDVQNGRELLIADTPEKFAANCLRLLNNPSEGKRLAENAWGKFSENWKGDTHAGRIAEIVGKTWGKSMPLKSSDVAFDVKIHSKDSAKGNDVEETNSIINPAEFSGPHVSVVIPAYNRANCVATAIESVLAQTFKDFEIIVVDDGSSDGTIEVLQKFGNQIHLIRQENCGVSAARNTGVRAARGKWIAFLDSDDCWHPEKLERQLGILKKYSGRVCFTRSVNQQNEILRDIDFITATPREPGVLYVENGQDSVCVSPRHPLIVTMIAEKILLERAGLFDESFHAAEDADLIFRISFLSGFLYVDSPLVTVSENSNNSLTYTERIGPLARRNQSYLRLLAQMYWRLNETSPEKTGVMRVRLGYFMSRRAEIACAAGQWPVARTLARDGIFFAGNFRDFVRCAGVLLAPGLVRSRAQKKWPA